MPLPDWASHYATLSDRELQAAYADLANAVDDAGIEAGESDYAKLQAMDAAITSRDRWAFLDTNPKES